MGKRHVSAEDRILLSGPCSIIQGEVGQGPVFDAAAERAKATFDSRELAVYVAGGEHRLKRRWAALPVLPPGRLGIGCTLRG
jgi:hypothetical protein